MTDFLDHQSRQELVNYRLEKSNVAIEEAKLLADNNFFDNAVTRLYYACFYAALGKKISGFSVIYGAASLIPV